MLKLLLKYSKNQKPDYLPNNSNKSFKMKVFNAYDFVPENRLDINFEGRHGFRPLHYAAQSGNNEIVGILLQFGADRNIRNQQSNV